MDSPDSDEALLTFSTECPLPDVSLSIDDLPQPTPEEMAEFGHILSPGFGERGTQPIPTTPAQSLTTAYTQKISLRLPHHVMTYLRDEAFRRGMGYQTVANMILTAAATGYKNF